MRRGHLGAGSPEAPALDRYPLVVTFASIGQGTDTVAVTRLRALIGQFERRNGVQLSVREADWGKEGEDDFCYPLSEVPPDKARALIGELRASFAGNPLVVIAENAPCHGSKNR